MLGSSTGVCLWILSLSDGEASSGEDMLTDTVDELRVGGGSVRQLSVLEDDVNSVSSSLSMASLSFPVSVLLLKPRLDFLVLNKRQAVGEANNEITSSSASRTRPTFSPSAKTKQKYFCNSSSSSLSCRSGQSAEMSSPPSLAVAPARSSL